MIVVVHAIADVLSNQKFQDSLILEKYIIGQRYCQDIEYSDELKRYLISERPKFLIHYCLINILS